MGCGAKDWRRPGAVGLLVAVVTVVSLAMGCEDPDLRNTPPPGARVDTFTQNAAAKIDVLWVVDNSPTMARQRENVARNFHRFFSALVRSNTDFHVAVTTTDLVNDNGRLVGSPAVINRQTPDPVGAFSNNIQVGETGNAWEQGLEAARRTFELHDTGFIRDDAYLFLVFVSDEDDQSQLGEPYYFFRYFKGLKGKGNEGMVSAGAIVGDVPDGCTDHDVGWGDPGVRYHEFVALMGGQVGSICDPAFDAILREMGMDAVGLQRKFQLTETPRLDELEVLVRQPCDTPPEELDAACVSTERSCSSGSGSVACVVRQLGEGGRDGWTYELATNSIVLHGRAIPPRGMSIEVSYREDE